MPSRSRSRSRWSIWKDGSGQRHAPAMTTKERDKTPSPVTFSKTAIEEQFAAVLADAVKQHAFSSFGDRRLCLDDLLNPPIHSVDDLVQQLSLENNRFTHFRSKRQSICDAISSALMPIQIFGEFSAGAGESAFKGASCVFGAVLYLIKVAQDVSSMYDSIIELFIKLKDFTARLEIYKKYPMTPALRKGVVDILALLFEVILIASETARQGRFRAYLKKLLPLEQPVESALSRLDALISNEHKQISAETYDGVNQIIVKTDRVQAIVSEVSQSIQKMKADRKVIKALDHKDKLKDILEPSPFPEDYFNTFQKSIIPGTGDWLLQDEAFQAWTRGDTQYFWMCGNQGTGKSYLTSRLITWGLENLPQIAYFFFRDSGPETRSVLQALRDIAYQLTETDAYYAEKLLQQLHTRNDIKTVASAYRRLFIQPFVNDTRQKSSVYVFLDGIDEADQEELHELLSLLAPSDDCPSSISEERLQLFMAGRPYQTEAVSSALDPDWNGQPLASIHITPDRISADVLAFIKDGVRHSRVLSHSTDNFKMDVVNTMNARVDGLFFLAKLMLAEVNRRRHPSSILKSLGSFPKEINGMLTKTMADLATTISDEELRDLREMLQWVTCAEESLTLEQLEAALILVFGDAPLRLEEGPRGQYACFFDLERADGLTTDDLVQEAARKQRETNAERTAGRTMSLIWRKNSQTSSDASSTLRNASPSPNRPASPALESLSPTLQFSPTSSPIAFELTQDMEFRSPSGTKVSFSHGSVRQFFREGAYSSFGDNARGAAIAFDIVAARVLILKCCLKIFIDKAWFEKQNLGDGKQAMKQYAAWYWQEHLAVLDPATVSASDRTELGMQIYEMLTSDDILYDWSIMYEKNNEGLDIFTDSNIAGLQKWLSDAVVQESLSPEARLLAAKAKEKEGPLAICERIGRFYAKAWLSQDSQKYVPTLFCFIIVQKIAFMDDGLGWSQMDMDWEDIPILKRISKAIEWANYPQTAHCDLRLGSTCLMLGLYASALSHYRRAELSEPDNVQIVGRIAYCWSLYGKFAKALPLALQCVKIEEDTLKDGNLQGHALQSCKWRLYKDYLLLGRSYYRTDQENPAREYFQKAIDSAASLELDLTEYLEAESAYIGMLAADNLHNDIMQLLDDMALPTAGIRHGRSRLTDLFLSHYSKPLVMDWIPKAACKSGKADWISAQLETAIEVGHRERDPTAVLYLRIALGTTCAYNRDINRAIDMFETISLNKYRPRGNIPTRQGHAISFQRLAQLYNFKVLQCDIHSPAAQEWIAKMEGIQAKQNQQGNLAMQSNMPGSDVNIASIYLASLYTALGRDLEANALLSKLVLRSIDFLLDNEPRNDESTLEKLLRAFTAANDISNALALVQSMRKVNSADNDLPVEIAMRPNAKRLPNFQSATRSCNQCLNNIFPSEEFVLCRFCLDAYCLKCLNGVIKGSGNKTSDGRDDVCCRSDHKWFTVPPLDTKLYRGAILMGDGSVKDFSQWAAGLRRQWGGVEDEDSQLFTETFWLT